MKPHHYPETAGLCVELKAQPRTKIRHVANGLNVDFDEAEEVLGFDIDCASTRCGLTTLETTALPVTTAKAA
ncbi:MAG: hypothetical protein P4L90_06050 [Rhodopila sp.]|nr:hypothetical protein [Rhodopila sp.]